MAKKAKNDGGGFDRISQFPDKILCRILSCLPTDEAVRTSILSSRWRYLFTSLCSFDVDISRLFTDPISRQGFAKFMVRMLYFRSESLEHFRLKRIEDCYLDFGRLYDWICAVLYRNVKELELHISDWDCDSLDDFEGLPPDLYICKSLVKLKLAIPFRPPPKEVPSCLLAHLKEIEISEFRGDIHLLEMIAYFLLNARVLEKLTIHMNCLEEQKRFSMTNQVLSLPRSSRNCQVVTDIS
ncbi:hypothetical protein COLO4_25132 [Corchorus olitorius]|uniref:F-box domain-containing protein n=1 Tax=Corchorus olitorius TaxID=93759 RepID=A0A1R3I4H1_9ROSI|nr:hypothetical protein COLO4_25132 [Corchorus olitorius]